MLDEIKSALDMDSSKHTWHNRLDTPEDWAKAVKVLEDKIESRLDDIERIRAALKNCKMMRDRTKE